MKKLLKWIKTQVVWFTSDKVLDAINAGATYDEVCEIVKEEVER